MNPYKDLPDYGFWHRSVSAIEKHKLDPVVDTKFQISASDYIATAGSCFAQNISNALVEKGFSYLVTEENLDVAPDERKRRNYGVYSARYGNIYTVRHLLQLLAEAVDERRPQDIVWKRADGKLVDALRPTIEPDGFPTEAALFESRYYHLKCIVEMIQKADVLVITLGLTEGWRSRKDGTVYPLAPGVSGGVYNSQEHEFVNFTVFEVTEDLRKALALLKHINNRLRIILTVSPVPLIATYEKKHVLVSTTYSKAVLRVAAEEIERGKDWIDYFPSYEIITGNYSCSTYYADDFRDVNPVGVAHVMRVFMKHYTQELICSENENLPASSKPDKAVSYTRADDIVCDEDEIESIDI